VNRSTFAVVMLLAAFVVWSPAEAHKAITSKHTYNADVYPIFLNRCSHCHVEGGVGPMSLVTYAEAFPWAESIRTELLDDGEDDPDDFVRAAHDTLNARELDIVLDWAVGGTPEGDAARTPPAPGLKNDWAGPAPDLVLRLPAPFSIPADAMELTHTFVLPANLPRVRSIAQIDLLPGTPAVVRDALVSIRTTGARTNVAGRWKPSQIPVSVAVPLGTSLSPGDDVILTIHYKKTWKYEGKTLTDQSALGLYFAP